MKRILSVLLALALSLAWLYACADPLALTDDLTGTLTYPAGANPADATYVYTYRYPCAAGEEEAALAVNAHYAYEVLDAQVYRVPMFGEQVPEGEREEVDVSYTITLSDDDFFSVLITRVDRYEGYEYVILEAQVFARNREKAGNIITLPYLLSILADRENDTWLQQRQTDKANSCVREMVMEQISRQPDRYYEYVDAEYLEAVFFPEEDFYMEAGGVLVFFVEPGLIAPDAEGPQRFSILLEDILDEI